MGRRRKYATLEELYSEKNRRRCERYAATKKQKANGPFNTTCTIAVKALRMMDNLAETSTSSMKRMCIDKHNDGTSFTNMSTIETSASSMKRMRVDKHNDGTSFTNMSTDDTIENPLSSSPLMNKYGSLGSPTIQSDEALTPVNIHGKSIANVNSIPIVPKDNTSDCNTLSTKKAAPSPKTSSSINSSSSKNNDVKSHSMVNNEEIYGKNGETQIIKHYYACYDSLQYPLIFANGEPGWHPSIERVHIDRMNPHQPTTCAGEHLLDPYQYTSPDQLFEAEKQGTNSNNHKRTTVSCREYYCYKLQIQPSDKSMLVHIGRLLQQFVVNMYIKIESSRLAFHRNEEYQHKFRTELYQGLLDSLS